jgi:hypothetical protein
MTKVPSISQARELANYLWTFRRKKHEDFNIASSAATSRDYGNYAGRSVVKGDITTLYHYTLEKFSDPNIPGEVFVSPVPADGGIDGP